MPVSPRVVNAGTELNEPEADSIIVPDMKTPTNDIDWAPIFDCLRRSGPEQGVFDTRTKRLVFRYLHDESWESEEVQKLVMSDPGRFVDLPHPSARERTVWRVEFARQHALPMACTKNSSTFYEALEERDLHERCAAFDEETIADLLVGWVHRNHLAPEVPTRGSLSERNAAAKPSEVPRSPLTQSTLSADRLRMTKATKKAGSKKSSAAMDPDLKGLPAGLQRQATALQANAKKALAKRATDALERARALVSESARGFYRLGQALVELRAAGMLEAIGYPDLYTLAESELSLSRTTVDRLLQAVAHLTQEQYAQLKPTRADALLDLAAATEADDTEAILQGARIALWTKGPVLDVGKASVRALREAAKDVRAYGKPKARGRSASKAERDAVEQANAALRSKASKAKARVRATKAGQASVFDLVDLTEAELARAMRALAR